MSKVNRFVLPKRPRHYAAEIIQLNPSQRESALENVPYFLRAWVWELVVDFFEKRRYLPPWMP